jgi:polysaccharide export outer membrane protein
MALPYRVILAIVTLLAFFASPASAQQPISNYTFNTGDRIAIEVFDEPELSVETLVDDSGALSYPLLGAVQVAGLTVRQLESNLTEGLRGRFLINPRVSVAIIEYRPFFVRGEVAKPGNYAFTPGLTVQKAVSIAGGFTDRASRTKFFITSDNDGERRGVAINDRVAPGDIIEIEESFF